MHTISGTTTTTAPETTEVKTKNGRLSNSSSLLDEDSEGDQVFLDNINKNSVIKTLPE